MLAFDYEPGIFHNMQVLFAGTSVFDFLQKNHETVAHARFKSIAIAHQFFFGFEKKWFDLFFNVDGFFSVFNFGFTHNTLPPERSAT